MVWCDDKEFPLEDQKPRATNNGGNCFFFMSDYQSNQNS
jgi:hypothetical protein